MKDNFKPFINGLITENPTFVLMLGMCPTLAVTTSAVNGLGMGLTTTLVLVMSNIFISLLRKLIPDSVRIPAFIVVIASFVTIVQMLAGLYPVSLRGPRYLYTADRRKLYHSGKGRGFCLKKQSSGFDLRRSGNGAWLYGGPYSDWHGKGASGKRQDIRSVSASGILPAAYDLHPCSRRVLCAGHVCGDP